MLSWALLFFNIFINPSISNIVGELSSASFNIHFSFLNCFVLYPLPHHKIEQFFPHYLYFFLPSYQFFLILLSNVILRSNPIFFLLDHLQSFAISLFFLVLFFEQNNVNIPRATFMKLSLTLFTSVEKMIDYFSRCNKITYLNLYISIYYLLSSHQNNTHLRATNKRHKYFLQSLFLIFQTNFSSSSGVIERFQLTLYEKTLLQLPNVVTITQQILIKQKSNPLSSVCQHYNVW